MSEERHAVVTPGHPVLRGAARPGLHHLGHVDRVVGLVGEGAFVQAFEFEVHPHFRGAVRVRRYDDLCGLSGLTVPALDTFRPLLESLVRRAREQHARSWLPVATAAARPIRAATRAGRRAVTVTAAVLARYEDG